MRSLFGAHFLLPLQPYLGKNAYGNFEYDTFLIQERRFLPNTALAVFLKVLFGLFA